MYPFPKEWQSTSTQASMVSPQHSNVDGKVWTNNQEDHDMYRLDLATGKFENVGPSKGPDGKQIPAYGMPPNHENNVYQLEFGGTRIGLRDAKTGTTTIYRRRSPARGRAAAGSMAQNRLWFAEYQGQRHRHVRSEDREDQGIPAADQVGRSLRRGADQGRRAKSGPARCRTTWSRGSTTKTGTVTEYLLPRPTNIRRVLVQEGAARGRCSGSAATTAPRSSRSSRSTDLRQQREQAMAGLCPGHLLGWAARCRAAAGYAKMTTINLGRRQCTSNDSG